MRCFLVLLVLLVAPLVTKQKENNFLCDTCVKLVNTVDQALEHGDDVEKAVHDFCVNDLPSFLVDACQKIVEQSLATIIEALKEHKPAQEICSNLHLC